MMTLNYIIDFVIRELEGGYVNSKTDRGGETKYGITKNLALSYKCNVATLTIDQAINIYTKEFMQKMKIGMLNDISSKITYKVFELAIHAGSSRAVKILQTILSYKSKLVDIDGILGMQTANVLKSQLNSKIYTEQDIIEKFVELQIDYYKNIVANDLSQQVYLKGWINRANKMIS